MDVAATLEAMTVLLGALAHLQNEDAHSVACRWLSRARMHLSDSLNEYLRGGKS